MPLTDCRSRGRRKEKEQESLHDQKKRFPHTCAQLHTQRGTRIKKRKRPKSRSLFLLSRPIFFPPPTTATHFPPSLLPPPSSSPPFRAGGRGNMVTYPSPHPPSSFLFAFLGAAAKEKSDLCLVPGLPLLLLVCSLPPTHTHRLERRRGFYYFLAGFLGGRGKGEETKEEEGEAGQKA